MTQFLTLPISVFEAAIRVTVVYMMKS